MTTAIDYAKYVQQEYKSLLGRTIRSVRPMTEKEMEQFGWEHCQEPGVVFGLDNGNWFIPMMDEEGNGPGALEYTGRYGY